MAKVKVYRKDTGDIVHVPAHWMEHPALSEPFRKTPSQRAREEMQASAEHTGEVASPKQMSTPRTGEVANPKSNPTDESAKADADKKE